MLRYTIYGRTLGKAPTFIVHQTEGCDAPQEARRLVAALSKQVPENEYWMEKS